MIAVTSGHESGFSVLELLVAILLALVVVSASVEFVNPNASISRRHAAGIELQQRLRFGADSLFRALYIAGAGLDSGPQSGALANYFATILPRRIGLRNPDGDRVARADAVTIIHVADTRAQAVLDQDFAALDAVVSDQPGCSLAQPVCGIQVGLGVLLFDRSGHFDAFTASHVYPDRVALRHRAPARPYPYPAGALVAEGETRTYYFDAAAHQLRQYDGDDTDAPVLDDVTAFRVEYFGDPSPPLAPKPPLGEANCLYDASGALVAGLPSLAPTDEGLARLDLRMLSDGPWCGDGATLFDADLLRVRRVRVTLEAFVPDTSANSRRYGASFDVTPRNLGLK
ncbi:MAG: hypothetical protein ABI652_04225 [Acidobacteriota bacterium]